eukprot:1159182-Pelagomonas_calceolata.AAC.2
MPGGQQQGACLGAANTSGLNDHQAALDVDSSGVRVLELQTQLASMTTKLQAQQESAAAAQAAAAEAAEEARHATERVRLRRVCMGHKNCNHPSRCKACARLKEAQQHCRFALQGHEEAKDVFTVQHCEGEDR